MPIPTPPFSLFDWIDGDFVSAELWVNLCKNALVFTNPLQLTDFQEATFPGYVPRSFEPREDGRIELGEYAEVTSEVVWWEDTGLEDHEEPIFAYYVTATFPDGSRQLVIWEPLQAIQVMRVGSKPIGLTIRLTATKFVVQS